MRALIALSTILFVGCAPSIASIGDKDDTASELGDEALPGDDGAPGTDEPGDGDGSGGEGGGGDTPDEPDPVTLQSGVWVPTGVGVEDDPCDFVGVLSDYMGLDIVDFLPTAFEVSGEADAFRIEAIDYGAQGPIDCEITGDEFECEEQRVSPLFYDLGRFGWEYGITYFGRVDGDDVLRGEAIVRYPSADDGTEFTLEQYGYDLSECTQTFYLEISAKD